MKFAIKTGCLFFILTASVAASDMRETVLRKAAIDSGFLPAENTNPTINQNLANLGKLVFESKLVSLGQDVSCATCHQDQFGSADGLANAVGVGGVGSGENRQQSEGRIVPRNTLPFWGRGGEGFNTFFWDGKVSFSNQSIESQFGDHAPSMDPLVIAAMLPPVEIDEMIGDVNHLTTETVSSAQLLYDSVVQRLLGDPKIKAAAQIVYDEEPTKLDFVKYAEAIAEFIRFNFAVQPTRFHQFVFGSGKLSEGEIAGGLVFYGKGRCSQCHNGPYFTNFAFHSIPSPSTSFGKNGFGVDYGRFNVTNNTDDRGKFRTPPLYNVTKTSPYGHAGAFKDLASVILAHSDPLAVLDLEKIGAVRRQDLYQQLRSWGDEPVSQSVLTQNDIDNLTKFLGTLEYSAKTNVISAD